MAWRSFGVGQAALRAARSAASVGRIAARVASTVLCAVVNLDCSVVHSTVAAAAFALRCLSSVPAATFAHKREASGNVCSNVRLPGGAAPATPGADRTSALD